MERVNKPIDIEIDMVDFHGIGGDNPYETPKSIDSPFDIREYVKVGGWGYVASRLVLIWYAILFLIYFSIFFKAEPRSIGGLEIILMSTITLIFLMHFLALFKVEMARKFVVFSFFYNLFRIPGRHSNRTNITQNIQGKTVPKSVVDT